MCLRFHLLLLFWFAHSAENLIIPMVFWGKKSALVARAAFWAAPFEASLHPPVCCCLPCFSPTRILIDSFVTHLNRPAQLLELGLLSTFLTQCLFHGLSSTGLGISLVAFCFVDQFCSSEISLERCLHLLHPFLC